MTLESLADTLGIAGGDIDYFLDLARMRHNTLYDAIVVAETDVEAAVSAAVDLSGTLTAWLEARGLLPANSGPCRSPDQKSGSRPIGRTS